MIPYLYKLVVELKHGNGDGAGNTIDRVVQDFGIRTMTFDPNLGFFLNGKSTPLRGVDMHQDYYHKAWGIEPANTDESLAIIEEIGANTLRLAHYPHAQYTSSAGRQARIRGLGRGGVRQQQHRLLDRRHWVHVRR